MLPEQRADSRHWRSQAGYRHDDVTDLTADPHVFFTTTICARLPCVAGNTMSEAVAAMDIASIFGGQEAFGRPERNACQG
jgi:hypothetical protein